MYLVTGGSGKLGAYVVLCLARRGSAVTAWSFQQRGRIAGVELLPVDLTDSLAVREAYEACDPEVVIHCAALSTVGGCYNDPDLADRLNHRATGQLCRLATRLVYVSTDLVFDGLTAPYSENSIPAPASVYGQSKLAGEQVLESHGNAVTVRVSLMYGPSLKGAGGFFQQQCDNLDRGEPVKLFTDEWRTPLALDDAAEGLITVADKKLTGVVHLGGPERLSRHEMGLGLAQRLKADRNLVLPVSQKAMKFPEPRASDVSLHCDRAKIEWGWNPSSYDEVLKRLIGNRHHS